MSPYAVDESAVQVLVNGLPAACLHCTPQHLEEMALGWLLGEGFVADFEDVEEIEADMVLRTVSVRATATSLSRPADRAGSHGSCERWPSIADIPPETSRTPAELGRLVSDPARLRPLFRAMFDRAILREAGGGIHTGALVHAGEVRLVIEDVGRHNLVDKIVGHAVRGGISLPDSLILLSARISGAIALKLWRTGVPAVATISVPSTMATDIASRCGITIVGRSLKQSPLHYPVTG